MTVTPLAARSNARTTVTVAVAVSNPLVAVIVAVPSPTEVTRPVEDTVVTAASDVAHVTVTPGIAVPPASFTVTVRVAVSPNDKNASTVSDSSRLAGTATVTAAVPLADPDVAVMVAVPLATAVTRPEEDTVATDALDELQVTLAPLMFAPF
jgi:hypothetical protein